VAVADDQVVNVYANWHNVVPAEQSMRRKVSPMKDAFPAAYERGRKQLNAAVWTPLIPAEVRLVYRLQDPKDGQLGKLVPAWQFQMVQDGRKGCTVYVNGFTNEAMPSPDEPASP